VKFNDSREPHKMRSIFLKVFIGAAIMATAMFGADSSLGTWKYNAAKSKTISTNPIKSRTDVYEAMPDGGVKVTRTELRADGTAYNFSYTFKYGGKEYPVTGGPFDTYSSKRIDANTTVNVLKKTGGAYNQTARTVYSKDGKTKTSTVKGTDAQGKPVDSINVYDKQQ
jgi:hypothetical protein